VGVVVVAGHRRFHAALAETGQALGPGAGARILGGLAYEPKSAEAPGGEQNGHPGRSLPPRAAPDLAGRPAPPPPPPPPPRGGGVAGWITRWSSGCAARSVTAWPSSGGSTGCPACRRCPRRTSGSSPGH